MNIGGDRIECARQRYNFGHFHFIGHRCVEKFMTRFRKCSFSIALEKIFTEVARVFLVEKHSSDAKVGSVYNISHGMNPKTCHVIICIAKHACLAH